MKKLKKLFNLHFDHQNNPSKQNQQGLLIQSDIIHKQPTQNLSECPKCTQQCKNCSQKSLLITKYSDLIKLLKIKINKLQKQLNLLSTSKPNQFIDDFDDFKMQLDSASLQTLKNRTQKILNPFKVIQLGPILQAADKHVIFDKTVKKSENILNQKYKNTNKKFVSQLKILDEEFRNKKQVTRTEKQIQKPHMRIGLNKTPQHQVGKSISFIQLMQKSQISLKSSKNLPFYSNSGQSGASSINGLSLDNQKQNSKGEQISLKAQSKNSSKQKNKKQIFAKCEILQNRIGFLSQTILDLKSFLLHVRHSIYQFVKMTDINHLRSKQGQSQYMLGVIIKIFEFSQDELEQMFGQSTKKNVKSKMRSFIESTLGR